MLSSANLETVQTLAKEDTMNSAMFLIAALALCTLPSALGLKCYHCEGSLANLKLCASMSDYTEQTCMTGTATCGTTEIKSNTSDVKAYILGCVEDPQSCSTYQMSLCANVTTAAEAANITIHIEKCNTSCCSEEKCNAGIVPTVPTEASTAPGDIVKVTTAAAQVFRPELIGISLIALMAAFFGLQ